MPPGRARIARTRTGPKQLIGRAREHAHRRSWSPDPHPLRPPQALARASRVARQPEVPVDLPRMTAQASSLHLTGAPRRAAARGHVAAREAAGRRDPFAAAVAAAPPQAPRVIVLAGPLDRHERPEPAPRRVVPGRRHAQRPSMSSASRSISAAWSVNSLRSGGRRRSELLAPRTSICAYPALAPAGPRPCLSARSASQSDRRHPLVVAVPGQQLGRVLDLSYRVVHAYRHPTFTPPGSRAPGDNASSRSSISASTSTDIYIGTGITPSHRACSGPPATRGPRRTSAGRSAGA